MRIGFLTAWDVRSRRSWSGTPYYMAQALGKHVGEVTFLGPFYPPMYHALDVARVAYKTLTGRTYAFRHSLRMARSWKRVVERSLTGREFDALFAPASSGLISLVETDVPILYASDATFDLMVDYNPHFSSLSKAGRREGDRVEGLAISKSSLCTFPTRWAADSAIGHYGAQADRVHVIPWGANFDSPPSVERIRSRRPSKTIRLLLVGVNWHYKGVDIAVDCLRHLRAAGVSAELTVVGCTPPKPLSQDGLTTIPFLSKHVPEQCERLFDLYVQSDLLILPTRNECYGIVFCEASAFGLPIVACSTGGVPGVVREGVNGHLLPPTSTGADYARLVREIVEDGPRHAALRESARAEFEQRLNWDAWGRSFAAAVSEAGTSRR